MTLSKETYIRITHEAHRYAEQGYGGNKHDFQVSYAAYSNGAEKEAERALPLLDHLTKIRDHLPENGVIRIRLTGVLTNYNSK